VSLEQFGDLLDALEYAGLILTEPEIRLHALGNGFPVSGTHPGVNPSVRNDFNITVGQQQIDATSAEIANWTTTRNQ
jgi:hypothetical protein